MKLSVAGAILFGLAGTAVLVGLAAWQLQRLAWKEGVIAEIASRIEAAPAALPEAPDPVRDRYLPVAVAGALAAGELHVLTSRKPDGPGFRVIAPFETADGRRILVDRGFVPEAAKDAARATGPATLTGTLLWPDESDGFTPVPDLGRNIWFARDVAAMAAALGAEPVLLVVREAGGLAGAPEPMPVGIDIVNDHLEYALTWSAMALVWAVMSVLLVRRELARR